MKCSITPIRNADDVYEFNYACSSAISLLEYGVFQSMFPGASFNGSVTFGLSNNVVKQQFSGNLHK